MHLCSLSVGRSALVVMLAGCEAVDEAPSHEVDAKPAESVRWVGQTPGGGFGARVTLANGVAFTSAPFAGEVWALGEAPNPTLLFEFGPGTFAGAGLATNGELLVGAPLAGDGRLQTGTGTVLAEGNGIGGVVAESPQGWVASTKSGWISASGATKLLNRRPDALAVDRAGRVVAGAAWGETALWVGDTPVSRAAPADEAGSAIVQCAGWDSILVGAPGEGTVYAVDSTGVWTVISSKGTGRFGATLACGPENAAERSVVIGAPHDGIDHKGAVYVWYESTASLELVAVGNPGDELGTSVAYDGESVWAGAPGGGSSLGAVVRASR